MNDAAFLVLWILGCLVIGTIPIWLYEIHRFVTARRAALGAKP